MSTVSQVVDSSSLPPRSPNFSETISQEERPHLPRTQAPRPPGVVPPTTRGRYFHWPPAAEALSPGSGWFRSAAGAWTQDSIWTSDSASASSLTNKSLLHFHFLLWQKWVLNCLLKQILKAYVFQTKPWVSKYSFSHLLGFRFFLRFGTELDLAFLGPCK